MERNKINTISPVVGRFNNLVSSGVITPVEWTDNNGDRQFSYGYGENKEAVDYLDSLQSAVKKIAKSTTPPWKEVRYGRNSKYVISRDAKSLWHSIRGVDVASKAWGREKHMSPFVAIGLLLARKWEPRLRWFTNANSDLLLAEEYPRRVLSHIVRTIRRVCSSKKFVCRVTQLERLWQNNEESCLRYFLSILRAHARPLVLRVDLYVEGLVKGAAGEGKIERAFEKFVRNLREGRIISDVLGYIIKREDAYDRRLHFHVMVMVDGDLHSKAYSLGEMVKAYWIHQCVGSPLLASGFNCYLRKEEYRYNAIGHVHYANENALRGVRDAINYLTKTDGHFLLPKMFGKNLRKGRPLRKKTEGSPGAPRKADMLLAERILLGYGVG